MYIDCIQIFSSNYLIKLTLTQNAFVVMQILKKNLLFKLTKGYHENSNSLYIIIFVIHQPFFNEKGLTLGVLTF